MRIILSSIDSTLTAAWRLVFRQSDVSVVGSDITILECDAIVSPANSFGFMDGGLDFALSERFGWDLEKKVQQMIKELPERELLVGRAMVVETGDLKVPLLISAPTMRVPTNFNVATSVNAYLAMKAILIVAKADSRIRTVAIPGLCTGVGRMPASIAANQMFMAYNEVILGNGQDFSTFGEAQKYHLGINPDGMIWTH